jgi:hypothetical protein
VVERIIDRYVADVMRYIPPLERLKAERDLKEVIYEMLEDYMEGERPVGRDARAVIRALGPAYYVASEYNQRKRKARRRRRLAAGRALDRLIHVILALSMICVILGAAALALGITDNMIVIFTGAMPAIALVIIGMFRPLPSQDRRRRRKRQAAAGKETY